MEGFRHFQIYAFAIIILLLTNTQASVIKFEAYPKELKANLTSSASMRCSLEDTDVTGGQIGKRSVTSTADDIYHIHAIYITRNNGENVASVSPFDAPIAEADIGNLQVKGDLSGTASQGYLELTWKDPSLMAMGEYVCEINTITNTHHSVLFTSTLEMTEVAPTMNDVIIELKSLNQKQTILLQKQETDIKDLKECASRRIGFMAVISSGFNGQIKTIARNQPVVFDKVIYSVGGSYDQTNGKFTCSEPGIYSFSINSLSAHKTDIGLNLKLNSNIITSAYSFGPDNSVETGATSALLHLKASDVVQVMTDSRGADFYQDTDVFQSNVFVGHMVQSDCLKTQWSGGGLVQISPLTTQMAVEVTIAEV